MSKFSKRIDKEILFDKYAKRLIHEMCGNVPEMLWKDEIIKERLHHIARLCQKSMKNGPILLTMILLIEYGHLDKRETFRFMADLLERNGYAGEASAHSIWYDTIRDNPEYIEHWRDDLEKRFGATSAKTIWFDSPRNTPEEKEKHRQLFKDLVSENENKLFNICNQRSG